MSKNTYKTIGEFLRVFMLCFFAYIGVSVVIDFIMGKAISPPEIERLLWKAPFMALVFTFLNSMRSVIEENSKEGKTILRGNDDL